MAATPNDVDRDSPASSDRIAVLLLAWYRRVHADREMPWRETHDPYAIWLSEIMLQQTQVETVKPYYRRFLEKFPTVATLAAASTDEVLALWSGLGYYRRAKHLHRAAQQIVAEHGGNLPDDAEKLRALPGIGRYTAGAIASIAFDLPEPVVDGNVMRVLARVMGYEQDIAVPKNQWFFWETAAGILSRAPGRKYGAINQALMELGATVCVPAPARPACLLCPLRDVCRANREGRQMELPVKSRREKTPVVRGVAVVVLRSRKEVLMMRRSPGGLWEGMWEFPVLPGGNTKRETRNATDMAARIEEKLGVKVSRIESSGRVTHQLTHRTMIYEVVRCELARSKAGREGRVMDGYAAARWEKWPPARDGALPMAKIVHKIAAAAMEHAQA